MIRIGVLGCGNIGGAVAQAVLDGVVPGTLVAVTDAVKTEQVSKLLEASDGQVRYYDDPAQMIAHQDIDLVFEAAHPDAVRKYALQVVLHEKDLVIMSIGGLVDAQLLGDLRTAADEHHRRVVLPSGAVSGVSTLEAARVMGGLGEVTLRTTKAPRSLKGAPFFRDKPVQLDELETKTLIFAGNVTQAISGFPQNVNVAAAVALAGLGPDLTRVEIFADPATSHTEHRLIAMGDFGELEATVRNFPNPNNPKSSYLATLGAISALKKYAEQVVMGY